MLRKTHYRLSLLTTNLTPHIQHVDFKRLKNKDHKSTRTSSQKLNLHKNNIPHAQHITIKK